MQAVHAASSHAVPTHASCSTTTASLKIIISFHFYNHVPISERCKYYALQSFYTYRIT